MIPTKKPKSGFKVTEKWFNEMKDKRFKINEIAEVEKQIRECLSSKGIPVQQHDAIIKNVKG